VKANRKRYGFSLDARGMKIVNRDFSVEVPHSA
jgi:hypothetical protein